MLLYPVKIFESSVPFFVLVPIALNTVLMMAVAFCFLVEYEETLFFMLLGIIVLFPMVLLTKRIRPHSITIVQFI